MGTVQMTQAQVAAAVYCERVGDGLWAEPLNALTNLAFLLAALLILWRMHERGLSPLRLFDLGLLVLLLCAIAVGSLLWHTLASPWSEWADVIPILLFISVYLLSYLVRIARLGPGRVVFWFLLFHLINTAVQLLLPQQTLNGSLFYLPTLAVLVLFALQTRRTAHPHARLFSYTAVIFTLSLLLRTLDFALCSAWPIGTHFLWHLLNAFVLYLLTVALLPAGKFPHTSSR
jgi:hypothetical protein